MFLSISTTYQPATDLGFLLVKHPDRVHKIELAFGEAVVFFPEATSERCEAALVLDVDPVRLVRGKGQSEGLLDQYVNDRPYVASSFLSVALNRIYRSAMAGSSRDRPDLAATPIPLEIVIRPLPTRGKTRLALELFEPLGWVAEILPLAEGEHGYRYVELRLKGTMRLSDALSHLYVLIPVLDKAKHYWIGDDEIEKLLSKSEAWLKTHPLQEVIARGYLKNRRDLVRTTLARLAPESVGDEGEGENAEDVNALVLSPVHDQRHEAVIERLLASGAKSVADLGCGDGKLLRRLVERGQFEKIIGLDTSVQSIGRASSRLKLGTAGGPKEGRVSLLHGALTYRDTRWSHVDAAVLVEVIEHIEPDRLPALARVVFGEAKPKTVIVTTPNVEYNAVFPNLPAGKLRHPDHRFEWTRQEFRKWIASIEETYGYRSEISGVGPDHPDYGHLSQIAVLTR